MKTFIVTLILAFGIVADIASTASANFARDFWEQQRPSADGDGKR